MKRVKVKNEDILLRPDGGHARKKSKLDNDRDDPQPTQVVSSNGKLEPDPDDHGKMMSTNREHRIEATSSAQTYFFQQQRQQGMKNQLWQIHSAIKVQQLHVAQLQTQLLRLLQQEYFNFLAMTSQSYTDEELKPILQFTLLAHENLILQADLLMLSIAGMDPIMTLYPVAYASITQQAPRPTVSTSRSEIPEAVTSRRCRHENLNSHD